MAFHNCVVLLVTVLVIFTLTAEVQGKRNYRIEIEETSFTNTEYVTVHYFRTVRYNTTLKVTNTSFTIHKDFPMDGTAHGTAYEMMPSGRYSMVPVQFPAGNLCDRMKKDKLLVEDLTKYGNTPRYCPWKAGLYYVYNYNINCETLPEVLPGTRWRFELKVTHKNNIVLKLTVAVFINRNI